MRVSCSDDLDSSADVSWCISTDLMQEYAWCIPFLMYGTDFDGFILSSENLVADG